MFGRKERIHSFKPYEEEDSVNIANCTSTSTCGTGSVKINFGPAVDLERQNVIYAPNLSYALVSVSVLADYAIKLIFESNTCTLEKDGLHIGKIYKDIETRLYKIPMEIFQRFIGLATAYKLLDNRAGNAGDK